MAMKNPQTTTTPLNDSQTRDANPDPITGAPGSHPVGTGLGAAVTGAAAVVAGGALGGPIGAAVGAVVGAVAGGYAGKAIEEQIDPTTEDAFWRDNFRTRPYIDQGTAYDDYQPAYQYGWESRRQFQGRPFDEVETELEKGWTGRQNPSNLGWDKARQATRDAWDRIDRSMSE